MAKPIPVLIQPVFKKTVEDLPPSAAPPRPAPAGVVDDDFEIIGSTRRTVRICGLLCTPKSDSPADREAAWLEAIYDLIGERARFLFKHHKVSPKQQRCILKRMMLELPDPELALPAVAPELYLERVDRSEPIVDFLTRVYRPWLGKGLTQADIRRLDKQAYMALHNWLRHSDLPATLDLPKKSDLVSREIIEADPQLIRTGHRLSVAAAYRRKAR